MQAAHQQHVALSIPLAAITPSVTNPRKRFDQKAMDELASSVGKHGVMQPILVRPNGKPDTYELVAGERRYRAAKQANLEEIPALVRELTDAEALELQVVENLQRQDLHPLEEAEGYEQLMKLPGHTVDDIAAKVGKSRAYVYARMKLCALSPKARDAFYAGELTPSTALLVARIPVAKLQEQATKEITKGWNNQPLAYRDAAEHIHDKFMLQLKDAPFKTGDATLLPLAGACTACPKRTGNQPELFDDVKNADVCTDPSCFSEKRSAHAKRLREAAIANGQMVISGNEAKKLKPSEHARVDDSKYITLDDRCYQDPRGRTFRQILGKDCPTPVLLDDPHERGNMIELVPMKDAKKLLADKVKVSSSSGASSTYSKEQRERATKAKCENAIRKAIWLAIRERVKAPLDRATFNDIAAAFYSDIWNEFRKNVASVWGFGDKDNVAAAKEIAKLSDVDVLRFLVDLSLVKDTYVSSYDTSKATRLMAAAERFGVDHAAIREDLIAQEKTKAKKKPVAKKPVTKKKRKAAAGEARA